MTQITKNFQLPEGHRDGTKQLGRFFFADGVCKVIANVQDMPKLEHYLWVKYQAKPLVEIPVEEGTEQAETSEEFAEVDERLKNAVLRLDPEDDTHWTQDGKPSVKVVEKLYGSADVTRSLIEAAIPNYRREDAAKPEPEVVEDAEHSEAPE